MPIVQSDQSTQKILNHRNYLRYRDILEKLIKNKNTLTEEQMDLLESIRTHIKPSKGKIHGKE